MPDNLFKDQPITQRRDRRRGVLAYQDIQELLASNQLQAGEPVLDDQIQPASLDLRLGKVGYEVRASFLPGEHKTVTQVAQELAIDRIDLTNGVVLRRGSVYILTLEESVSKLKFAAKANPKSTTGRLDLFTRLITERAEHFDQIEKGYSGPLYVEVAPKTFNVRVRSGTKLNQVRFFKGISSQFDETQKALRDKRFQLDGEQLIYGADGEPRTPSVSNGLWFSVDLQAVSADGILGWKAINHSPVVDFECLDYYDPAEFWEPVMAREDRQLILQPGEFYILGSRERVTVPPSYAAEMVPYDASAGEFRVHYAGFFDPGFGYGEHKGTRAILEVRSYEIPYLLRDGQRMGRLIYQPLLEEPTKLYGSESGSSYQDQRLGLSKQFRQPAGLAH